MAMALSAIHLFSGTDTSHSYVHYACAPFSARGATNLMWLILVAVATT
jgi:hypothetical protein